MPIRVMWRAQKTERYFKFLNFRVHSNLNSISIK